MSNSMSILRFSLLSLAKRRQNEQHKMLLARATQIAIRRLSSPSSSSSSSSEQDPISKVISGVTMEDYNSNPDIKSFIDANFPDIFKVPEEEEEEEEEDSDDNIDDEEKEDSDDNIDDEEKEDRKKYKGMTFGQIRRAKETYPLNVRPLYSYMRNLEFEEGSRYSEKLRNKGFVPGMIYGGDPTQGIVSNDPSSKVAIKTPYKFLQSELDRFHRNFECRVYDIMVYDNIEEEAGKDNDSGTVYRVTPSEVQRHPISDKWVYCTNFLRYYPGRCIKIPIIYINEEESPVLKRDGFIIPVQKHVECIIDDATTPIPEYLEVECSGLQLKEKVKLDRVLFPEGVRPSDRTDVETFLIGVVRGSGRGLIEEDEDAAGDNAKEEDDD